MQILQIQIQIYFPILLIFFESLKVVSINMVAILTMPVKLATLGFLEIISVLELFNKILSCDSNYIADVVIWLKFGNSSIVMRKFITSTLYGFDQFLRGALGWFKFNNLGLTLVMALTFYTSVAKGSRFKVRTFWSLQGKLEVTGEKLVKGVGGGY